jgi:hypothetical protein
MRMAARSSMCHPLGMLTVAAVGITYLG